MLKALATQIWNVLHGENGFDNFYGMRLFVILVACEEGDDREHSRNYQSFKIWRALCRQAYTHVYCELRDELPIEI